MYELYSTVFTYDTLIFVLKKNQMYHLMQIYYLYLNGSICIFKYNLYFIERYNYIIYKYKYIIYILGAAVQVVSTNTKTIHRKKKRM